MRVSLGIGVIGILLWGMYVFSDKEETNEDSTKRKEKHLRSPGRAVTLTWQRTVFL